MLVERIVVLLLLLVAAVTSLRLVSTARRICIRSQFAVLAVTNDELPPGRQLNPDLQEFLAGPEGKKWKGTRDILRRRQQVPLPEYSPVEVCRTILAALQDNDLPQLDNGAAVVLEFKSPSGPLAEGSLDPAAYGRFLRGTEDYASLLDFKSAEMVGEPLAVGDSLSVRQTVKVVDWQSSSTNRGEKFFDIYLTQHAGCWLVDVILSKKG